MAPDREERIRQLAHDIWEREGRPEGREAEHWRLAEQAYDTEARATAAGQDGATPSRTAVGQSLDVLALGGPQPALDTPETAGTVKADEAPTTPVRWGRKPKAETAPAPKRKRRTKAEMAAAAVAAGAAVAGAAVAATVVTSKRKRAAMAGTSEAAPAAGAAPRRPRKTKVETVLAAPEMASDAPSAVAPDTPPEAAPEASLSGDKAAD